MSPPSAQLRLGDAGRPALRLRRLSPAGEKIGAELARARGSERGIPGGGKIKEQEQFETAYGRRRHFN